MNYQILQIMSPALPSHRVNVWTVNEAESGSHPLWSLDFSPEPGVPSCAHTVSLPVALTSSAVAGELSPLQPASLPAQGRNHPRALSSAQFPGRSQDVSALHRWVHAGECPDQEVSACHPCWASLSTKTRAGAGSVLCSPGLGEGHCRSRGSFHGPHKAPERGPCCR